MDRIMVKTETTYGEAPGANTPGGTRSAGTHGQSPSAELLTMMDEVHTLQDRQDTLLAALKGTYLELRSILKDLNEDRMPHDGDEFHERLQAAYAAIVHVDPTWLNPGSVVIEPAMVDRCFYAAPAGQEDGETTA